MAGKNTHKKKEGFSGQKAVVLPRQILTSRCANNPVISNLYISDIGFYPKAEHHYRERPGGSNQHILIYCREGKGNVQIDKVKLDIEPGDFFVIPAKTPHIYSADEQKPWTIYWIHFTGSVAAAIVAMIRKKGAKGFLKHSEPTIALFDKMYSQLEYGYSHDSLMFANMCLWQFLNTFMYNEKYGVAGKTDQKDAVNLAIDHMRKNITEVLTAENIARAAHLSTSHFTYLFKTKTGFSPIEYFNHLKIQQACQYLLFTELRVKEIAAELGIEDPHYFSRMFKKVMGMSPDIYREKRIQ